MSDSEVSAPTLELVHDDEWKSNLIVNQYGSPKPILANAITAIRGAHEWTKVLGYNEFSSSVVALKGTPWDLIGGGREWTDHDERLMSDWLQHNDIFTSVEITGQAIQVVARDHSFHPVRQYLDSLMWDRQPRIGLWLPRYLHAQESEYTSAIGARWLISAVARVYEPGCKADCCLILEGRQGLKKSTALRTLGHPWFTDEIAELGSKDAALQTRGRWIIELSELDSLSRTEVSRINSFMSRSADRFRPPYGRQLIESPRHCIFAGSVNHPTYLRDETGARRFWPVACTNISIDELARDRDQLWAEAVSHYREGAPWWLESRHLIEAAEAEQAERYDVDPWIQPIAKWLEGREDVSIAEILTNCIQKRKDQWSQLDKSRVARCLRTLEWRDYRGRDGQIRTWRWRRNPDH